MRAPVLSSPMGVLHVNKIFCHRLLVLLLASKFLLQYHYVLLVTCCCAVLLAATCADAMARACCSKEEVAWRLATVMAALLGRIGGGPYSQSIMFVKKYKVNHHTCT